MEGQPGDFVTVSHSFGWFRPKGQSSKNPVSVRPGSDGTPTFVATGTGIAPFLAWLRSVPDAAPPRLFYGVRQLADAVYTDELQNRCVLELFVSRESAPPPIRRGRVTEALAESAVIPNGHYYLCGLDTMIDEGTRMLEARGVPITSIHRECFFNADSE